ncbi:V-type proton ATPase subunit S1-like protein [Fukomys damarensis]|uniref:V-type proton ATPase subunit S1-like protein n=1 Tax=Fukomys damarensis TaxID=885580 RepID=UPI0005402BB6|nr:V-type proton ATPase subunit S1-like protein [Fukomys damarensis]
MLSVTQHKKSCLCCLLYELTDVLGWKKLICFLMGRKILFIGSFLFLCIGFSLTLELIFVRKNVSSRTSSNREAVVKNDQQANGEMKPVQNFTPEPITQALNYNQSKGEHDSTFSPHNPMRVAFGGTPCILFWARRITVTFQNQTWLDLTDAAFGRKAVVDTHSSNCSEESATLSLKFGDTENPTALAIRFVLSNGELPGRSWFSLRQVEIVLNGSTRASFLAPVRCCGPATRGMVPARSSGAFPLPLLRPGHAGDGACPWAVTLLDLQIQGFAVQGGQFAEARDCAPSLSPAVLLGLAVSLILLLVLAYALHMLLYLRLLDRHYEFIATSPTHFPQLRAHRATEEKELLRSQGQESYELQSQQICKIYA